jgi:phosphonate transport system substrate-binding protein
MAEHHANRSQRLLLLALVSSALASLAVGAAPEAAPSAPVLTIGLVPQDNAVKMVKRWQPFADYLSTRLNRPVEITIRSDYRGVTHDLLRGDLDVALLGSFEYLQAASSGQIVPLVRRVIFGSDQYRSFIVVRSDSPAASLADLRGKRFAFTDQNSTTGYALPRLAFRAAGLPPPERFFSEVIFTGNHDSALLAIYAGSVDGAALSTTRFDPRNVKVERLKVIWRSAPIPLGPFVARKELGSAAIADLRRAILELGSSPDARRLLDQIGVDGFVPAEERDYRSLKASLRTLEPRSSANTADE